MNSAIKLNKSLIREMRVRHIQSHCDICDRQLNLMRDVIALVDVDKGRVRCVSCALKPENDNVD